MKNYRKILLEVLRSNILKEEGEASGMTTNSGIAGLGTDASVNGNVVVRKKPKIFKRRKI